MYNLHVFCVLYGSFIKNLRAVRYVVQLIYLCDTVALMTGIGGGADGLSYHAHGEVMKQYNLREKDIERFIILLEDRFQLVDEILNRR